MLIGCLCGGLIEAAILTLVTCFTWLVRLGLRRRQHATCTTSCQHHKHSG